MIGWFRPAVESVRSASKGTALVFSRVLFPFVGDSMLVENSDDDDDDGSDGDCDDGVSGF